MTPPNREKQNPYELWRVALSSANAESLDATKIFFYSQFPLYSIARYFVPTRYSSVLSAAAMCVGDGFCRNSDRIETDLDISGRVITAEKLMLPTRCWYP